MIAVRLDDKFCDDAQCFAGKDGVSYYFDQDHMSLGGALIAAQAVAEALKLDRH